MCGYSLETYASRPAVTGDKLVTFTFGLGTTGFVSVDDPVRISTNPNKTAICLLPGTELAFDEPVAFKVPMAGYGCVFKQSPYTTAVFRQVDMDKPRQHHDCLEFPTGTTVFLNQLCENQHATVLQLPAKVGKEPDLKELKSALEDVREALKEIV